MSFHSLNLIVAVRTANTKNNSCSRTQISSDTYRGTRERDFMAGGQYLTSEA
jgi:hypothetical protein